MIQFFRGFAPLVAIFFFNGFSLAALNTPSSFKRPDCLGARCIESSPKNRKEASNAEAESTPRKAIRSEATSLDFYQRPGVISLKRAY